MGTGFLVQRGGSSGGSGLTIVGGTTRPAKASQNMIWIDTDAEITDYVLSATEPESPVDGMAWISIGDSGRTKAASPVGGDWFTVYPMSAKQYVSGAWVSKEAKSYQDGEWVDWVMYLYKEGDKRINITGGWVAEGKKYQSSSTTTAKKPELTFHENYMYMSQTGVGAGLVYPVAKIDLTVYNKLVAEGEFYAIGSSPGNWTITIWTELGTYYYGEVAYKDIPLKQKITRVEMDVSGLNGMYVVGFVLNSTGASSSDVGYNKVEKFYLE